MDLKNEIQKILDDTLLKYGILSFHIRRIKTDKVEGESTRINDNEYVVFRIVSTAYTLYGDGQPKLMRRYIDINYYYNYEKDDSRYNKVIERIKEVKKAFISDKHFILKNGESDLPDLDSPYRGINIEFSYYEVCEQ